MRRDIILEKEVENTIKKFNSIKVRPNKLLRNSCNPKFTNTDKALIAFVILVVLFAVFQIFRGAIINSMYDKINETGNLQSLRYLSYDNYGSFSLYYSPVSSSTAINKSIQIEKGIKDT